MCVSWLRDGYDSGDEMSREIFSFFLSEAGGGGTRIECGVRRVR